MIGRESVRNFSISEAVIATHSHKGSVYQAVITTHSHKGEPQTGEEEPGVYIQARMGGASERWSGTSGMT